MNPCRLNSRLLAFKISDSYGMLFWFLFLNIPGLCPTPDQYPLMFQATCHSCGSISHFACLGGCHSDRGALKPPSARRQGLRLPGVPRRWQARQKRQCNLRLKLRFIQAYPTVEDSLSQRYSTANILSTLPNRKDSAFHLDRASSHEGKASKWKLFVCQNSLPLLLHRFLHLYLPPW